jgi:hypothetical protein
MLISSEKYKKNEKKKKYINSTVMYCSLTNKLNVSGKYNSRDCSIVLLSIVQAPSLLSMTCKMPGVRKPSCHAFVAHRDPQTSRILKE